MQEVAIIGGGASGFAAAIELARQCSTCHITIYERLEKPLKKILATGNGRCNLTNMTASKQDYFGDIAYFTPVFKKFSPKSTLSFFTDMGLCTKEEELGRVYPLSSQASSVRDLLLSAAKEHGIQIVTACPITKVQAKKDGTFLLNGTYKADFVVLAFGGKAGSKHGTDGSAYALFEQLQIPMVAPAPALTALYVKENCKSLKGVRQISAISLWIDGKERYQIVGEVQFTDYGLSGVPIMQLSRLCSTAKSDDLVVKLNCLPQVKVEDLLSHLSRAKSEHPNMSISLLLSGLLPKVLSEYILKCAHIRQDAALKSLEKSALQTLVKCIGQLKFTITGTKGFEFAQVTAGGADGRAFFDTTLECKKIPHLYAAGEALNVDGGCGGYNLQWAWCSGRAVGEAIAKEISL